MCFDRYFSVTVPSDYFRKDIRYFLSITCIRLGNQLITNQNLFDSKKSSRIKAIKYRAATNVFSLLSAMMLTSREK